MPAFPARPLSDAAGETLDRATHAKYRLDPGEALADGVRRVALGRLDSAVGALRGTEDAPDAETIHEVRKDLKKLRSALRLVRGPLGSELYAAENDRYRQAARLLGAARDAEVRAETLALLTEWLGDPAIDTDRLAVRLAEEREAATVSAGDIERAAALLTEGVAILDTVELDAGEGFALVAAGVRRAYRRGRDSMRVVERDPDPELVHAWRKRVKDLWYHLRLFGDSWPDGLGGVRDSADRLSDLLGDHHDLTVLADHLGDDADADLGEAIGRRQRELLAEALPEGRLLYAESPRAFTRRLGAYWTASAT